MGKPVKLSDETTANEGLRLLPPLCGRDRCSRMSHRGDLCRKHYSLKLAGRPSGMVPVGPVRGHLDRLLGAGLTQDRIAVAARVSRRSTIRAIYEPGRVKMRAFTAARIMAVPIPESPPNRGAGYMPALGTQRRLRALVASGYQQKDLAARMGMSWQTVSGAVNGNHPYVLMSTAAAVDELFRELQLIPGGDGRAKLWAQRRGWYPPLAWDEDDLDKPSARPQTSMKVSDTWFRQYTSLRARGFNMGQVAARMGIHPATLSKRLSGRAA